MDLGERIERGMRDKESCAICRNNVAQGETFKPFECGHVAHLECTKLRFDGLRRGKRRVKEEYKNKLKDIDDTDTIAKDAAKAAYKEELAEYKSMKIRCQQDHLMGHLDTPLMIPIPAPVPISPHLGYTGLRRLCGFCYDGTTTFERMVHAEEACGMIACRRCVEINRRNPCPVCGKSLSTCQPINIDPRELEDILNRPQN